MENLSNTSKKKMKAITLAALLLAGAMTLGGWGFSASASGSSSSSDSSDSSDSGTKPPAVYVVTR
jgi:flagellar basal body-associated protein FliL